MSDVRIAPSILSADFGRLAEQVALVAEGGADFIHVDVMDGRFVPNLTFGAGVIAAVRRVTDLPVDVHLMVVEPEQYIRPFADAGASLFTLHPEATRHPQRQLVAVREAGMRAGLALNPGTPLAHAAELVEDFDLLLIMSVNPGFPGQHYISGATGKVARARHLLDEAGSAALLEVDGGITPETIGAAHAAGADTFVAGSAVFGAPDPPAAMRALRRACAVRV